jgi:hypothetical protein
MLADPAGRVARVLKPAEFKAGGGFPDAAFVVGLKLGRQLGPKLDGPVEVPRKLGEMHGYLPQNPEMQSSFFLAGPSIQPGLSLGTIDVRDIVPTLAEFLGFSLNSNGHSLVCPSASMPAR